MVVGCFGLVVFDGALAEGVYCLRERGLVSIVFVKDGLIVQQLCQSFGCSTRLGI
jgi:hypothetical protein